MSSSFICVVFNNTHKTINSHVTSDHLALFVLPMWLYSDLLVHVSFIGIKSKGTLPFKNMGAVKYIFVFIKGYIKFIVKTFTLVRLTVSNKHCSFERSEKKCIMVSKTILSSSTLFNI